MKNLANKNIKNQGKTVVHDYGNDPFFVSKADRSKIFLEKHGFPKDLLEKKRNTNTSK